MLPSSLFDFTMEQSESQGLSEYGEKILKSLKSHKALQSELFGIACNVFKNDAKKMRSYSCGTEIAIHEDTGRLAGANFCKWRLCPMCAWRKSLKKYGENMEIVRHIQNQGKKRFIFLTLTMVNCEIDKLEQAIDFLNAGWKRMANTKRFKEISLGYFKSLEITYNKKKKTWHPHFHVIVCVEETYFKSRKYIRQSEMRKMWQKATRDDNITQIDMSAIKASETESAVAEVSKYAVKILNVLTLSDDNEKIKVLKILDEAVGRRRLINSSGIFREAARALKIDIDNEDDVQDNAHDNENIGLYEWDAQEMEYIKRCK